MVKKTSGRGEQVCVYMKSEFIEKLDQLAALEGSNRSQVISKVMNNFFSRN